jgi:hypothetical protein
MPIIIFCFCPHLLALLIISVIGKLSLVDIVNTSQGISHMWSANIEDEEIEVRYFAKTYILLKFGVIHRYEGISLRKR